MRAKPTYPPSRNGLLAPASAANAGEGEVPAVHIEVELHPERLEEGLELLRGNLLDAPTTLADQVLVVVVGQVEDRRPVSKVGVVDDPELLEGVEGAVDGRDVDRWEPAVDLRGDVLGRDVRLGGEES